MRALDGHSGHLEREDLERLGAGQAVFETLQPPLVHQEADRAEVHPEDGQDAPRLEHGVERLEHEAVAAQGDHGFGLIDRNPIIIGAQFLLRRERGRRRGGDERAKAHPPVTLIWRATAGAAPGATLKSWRAGLAASASAMRVSTSARPPARIAALRSTESSWPRHIWSL